MDIWFWVNDWYSWVLLYIGMMPVGTRLIGRSICKENFDKGKDYALLDDSDRNWTYIGGTFFWWFLIPFLIVFTVCESIGENPNKLLGKPPKKVRKEIERKAHEERERELGLVED
jgi:hypothetical protein